MNVFLVIVGCYLFTSLILSVFSYTDNLSDKLVLDNAVINDKEKESIKDIALVVFFLWPLIIVGNIAVINRFNSEDKIKKGLK